MSIDDILLSARNYYLAQESNFIRVASGDYVRRDGDGALSFAQHAEFLDRAVDFGTRLRDLETTNAPARALMRAGECFERIAGVLTAVRSFTVANEQDWRASKANVVTQIQTLDAVVDASLFLTAYLRPSQGDVSTAGLERAEAVLAETSARITKVTEDGERVLARLRDALKEKETTERAREFEIEAEKHARSSQQWLERTVWVAAATFWSAVGNVLYAVIGPAPTTATQSVQLVLAKLLYFSVLLSAVVWSGKIYRAHRHNEVVNRHRSNALRTFAAFAEAAGDDVETKGAVMRQAMSAIYAPQPSGYIDHEQEQAGPTQVVELARSFGAMAKP